MSDATKPPEEPESVESSDDAIARLIRLAGPRPPAPQERTARVRDIVHARWREAVRRDRRRIVVLVAAPLAAAIIVVIGAGFWLRDRIGATGARAATVARTEGRVLLRDGRVAEPGGILVAGAGLTTGPDGRAALRLDAGPSVRLDTGTELRLVSTRVLELRRGGVYVDTGPRSSRASAAPAVGAEGPASPIEIRTTLGRVHDVGTQFEVRLTDDTLRVSVREGIAALSRDDRAYAVPAGTRLRVDPRGAVETGTIALRGGDWEWVLAVAPPFEL